MEAIVGIGILIFIIITLITVAIMQINMAGIEVKDFWSFIKANEKAMVFPSINDAVFWLIRVVKNASLNYAKRKVREANAYHKALYEGRQQMESGETELLKKEAKKIALEALNKLPDNLKEVLILKEYADMNYKEIGRQLGITEGNVKVRVFRAKAQLLKLIGEEDVYLS